MTKDIIKIKGFYRLQLEESGKIIGDSGWLKNQVVNLGFRDYLVRLLGSLAGSKQVSHVLLGTGGAPAAADTSLAGEITDASNSRAAVTAATSGSKTLQLTATFASSDSFVTTSHNISNIALVNTSTTAVGTIFAGNTYTSSSLNTNQNVNVTYEIQFS